MGSHCAHENSRTSDSVFKQPNKSWNKNTSITGCQLANIGFLLHSEEKDFVYNRNQQTYSYFQECNIKLSVAVKNHSNFSLISYYIQVYNAERKKSLQTKYLQLPLLWCIHKSKLKPAVVFSKKKICIKYLCCSFSGSEKWNEVHLS